MGAGVVEACFEEFYLFGFDERFVALDVDYYVAGAACFDGCFVAAVGSAPVCVGCHDCPASEAADGKEDAFVVGGDDGVVD